MTDKYLEGVVGIVEADSYAHHCLWLSYATDAEKYGGKHDSKRYEWKETGHGYGQEVGRVDGRGIWISLLTATVGGHKLLFWHATSPVVDYDQCDAWFKANLPETAFRSNGYINSSDPMNFSNVFPRERVAA